MLADSRAAVGLGANSEWDAVEGRVAVSILGEALRRGGLQRTLQEAVSSSAWLVGDLRSERDLLTFLRAAVLERRSHQLLEARRRRVFGFGEPEPEAEREPEAPEEIVETRWLRILLVDEEGEPVPDAAFEVELDDGSLRSGTTDAAGEAYLRDLPPGRAKVRWPDLHPDDWGRG